MSEYGAAIWADPFKWIPEAARLLRVGGELVFLANSLLFVLCAPDKTRRPGRRLFVTRRVYTGWIPDDPGVEFHLPHGDMLRLLRATASTSST